MIRSCVYAGLIVSLSIFDCSGTLQGLVPRIYSQYGGEVMHFKLNLWRKTAALP